MEAIVLNINEYSDTELEEILSLTYPYNDDDVIVKKNELHKKLLTDQSVTVETKGQITKFLETVTSRLCNSSTITNVNTNFNNMKNSVNEIDSHFIIQKEADKREAYNSIPTDGLTIDKYGTPPGIINPLNYRTITRALNVDSKFRPNYYETSSADQRIVLPYKFENVVSMRLASVDIPRTYYAVSESLGNNSFVVNWDKSTGVYKNSVLVKIPDGNYHTLNDGVNVVNSSAIESILNASLLSSTAIKPTNSAYNGITIQSDTIFNLHYTVDSTSGKSVFALDVSGISDASLSTIITNKELEYEIVFGVDTQGNTISNQPLPFYLGWSLGYRVNTYSSGSGKVNGSNNILPSSVVSEGICYVKGPQYIFIAIDDFNNNVNNYYVSAYSDSINNKNILTRINPNITTEEGTTSQINRSRNYFGPVNIERIRITLFDEYGRIINLNNMDWSCSLMFECMYS